MGQAGRSPDYSHCSCTFVQGTTQPCCSSHPLLDPMYPSPPDRRGGDWGRGAEITCHPCYLLGPVHSQKGHLHGRVH